MSAYEFIEYEVQNGIATLRLNRPPVNALGQQLVAELTAAARQINLEITSRKIRAVILSGNGKHFCAGADLKERLNTPETEVENVVQRLRGAIQAVADLAVPTIAAVHGSALGGGLELALAADLRVLSEDATLGLRETALAIIPGAGGTQRLMRLIGYARAMEWIATASTFSAAECLSQGLANRVVPAAEVEHTALQLAERIAANGPLAVRAAKEAMRRGLDMTLSEGLAYEMECYRRIIATHDRREALQAFSEKRQPVFRGE